mmetsp:Transcript_41979/g.65596  ORF Transcript_41979/g.65596 Transcript_41979/m.65596 type:complete len:243 (-) Transcript_41979:2921-3649(-)
MKLSRSTRIRKKIHGFILKSGFFLACRKSAYKINEKCHFNYGKGIYSRSEPLKHHPNPSFNSIGRAGREYLYFKQFLMLGNLSEYTLLGFSEIFFWNRLLNLKIDFSYSFKWYKEFYLKTSFLAFFETMTSKISNFCHSSLKTGIKFGGNFLAYFLKKKKSHSHSLSIINQIMNGLIEKGCINCNCRYEGVETYIQGSSRLSNHVSKQSLFIGQSIFSGKIKSEKKVFLHFIDAMIGRNKRI